MTPRRRNPENVPLPNRWRHYHGAYYYQVPKSARHLWDNKVQFKLGTTLPEAYKVWAERLQDAGRVITIGQLLDRYALQYIPTLAAATQTSYALLLGPLREQFGHMPLTDLRPVDVYGYVDFRGGRIVAHREVELLSGAFSRAVEWGLIDSHPFKGEVRLRSPTRTKRYVEHWEIAEVLALKPMRKRGSVRMLQAYIRLKLADIGARQTDMLQLRPSDAKDDGIHVTASKTGKRQIFKWTPERRAAWAEALAARPKDIAPWVFCDARGECYVRKDGRAPAFQNLWQRFMARVLAETKVTQPFTERALRAKVASDAVSVERAAQVLGHSDTKVTVAFYRRKPQEVE